MMAVGLGFGAALAASTAGIAWADPANSTLVDAVDQLASAAAAAPGPSTDNFAMSFDGISLTQEGNAIALSTPGQFGLAIAEGDGSQAISTGFLDSAIAGGTGTTASATGSFDAASALGDGSEATAGTSAKDVGDTASAYGIGTTATSAVGSYDSASVNGATGDTAEAGGGNNDSASIIATLGHETATATGGNFDIAQILYGADSSTAYAGEGGSYDWAADLGYLSQEALHASAVGANYLVDIEPVLTSLTSLF
jgi:trimeric autotransporter adhesin